MSSGCFIEKIDVSEAEKSSSEEFEEDDYHNVEMFIDEFLAPSHIFPHLSFWNSRQKIKLWRTKDSIV